MNKIYIFGAGLISALLFTAAGCSSDVTDDLGMEAGKQVSITAQAVCGDGMHTRVYLGKQDDNKQPLLWGKSDEIGVAIDGTFNEAYVLSLASGATSTTATFRAASITLPNSNPTTIAACYPTTAFEGVDLTNQTYMAADYKNEVIKQVSSSFVLYAQSEFSLSPTFTFQSRVSILDIHLKVDTKSFNIDGYSPRAIIKGCNSQGVLQTDGTWSNLKVADIVKSYVSKTENEGGEVTYHFQIAVIPGTPVKDILIGIEYYAEGGDNPTPQKFVAFAAADPYESQTAVIPENSFITINRTLTKQDFTILDGYGCDTSNGEDGWK